MTAGALVAGAALVGCSSAEENSDAEEHSLEHADLVPAFETEQGTDDELPQDSDAAEEGEHQLDRDSSRLLGESDYGKHWAAVDDEGNICLVTELPDGADDGADDEVPTSGSACRPPEDFYESGTFLQLTGEDAEAWAYLLPSDMDEESVSEATEMFAEDDPDVYSEASQLIVTSPEAAQSVGEVKVERADGDPVVLSP